MGKMPMPHPDKAMKHLLGIEPLTAGEISALVDHALILKRQRSRGSITTELQGETWAMIFTKSSRLSRPIM